MGLVLEELVDELDAFDPVFLAGDLGEIEVVDLLLAKRALCSDHSASEILKSPILPAAGLPDSSAAEAPREPTPSRAPLATVPSRNRRRLILASLIGPVSLLKITRTEYNGSPNLIRYAPPIQGIGCAGAERELRIGR